MRSAAGRSGLPTAKPKERAAIPHGLGQPHACQFGFIEEQQYGSWPGAPRWPPARILHGVSGAPSPAHAPTWRRPAGRPECDRRLRHGHVNTPDNRGTGGKCAVESRISSGLGCATTIKRGCHFSSNARWRCTPPKMWGPMMAPHGRSTPREVRQRFHIAIPAIGPAVGQHTHAKVKVRRAIVNCITAQPNLLRRVPTLSPARTCTSAKCA